MNRSGEWKPVYDFAQALQAASKHLQLYSPDHPRSADAVRVAHQYAEQLLGDRERFHLATSRGKFFVDREQLEPTLQTAGLLKQFEERKISGFVITRGVRQQEIQTLVQILAMKNEQIARAGGAAQILADGDVTHLRFTTVRYEELLEGEEIVPSGSTTAPGLMRSEAAIPLPEVLRSLVMPLLEAASKVLVTSQPGANGPATIAHLEQAVETLEVQDDELSAALRKMIEELSPDEKATLLMTMPSLRSGRLRSSIAAAGPELINEAGVQRLVNGSTDVAELAELLDRLLSALPRRDRTVDLLRARLIESGMSREQLDELLELLSWQNLESEEKFTKILRGSYIFQLPSEKLLTFMHHLLVHGREAEVTQLIDRYSKGLFADASALRRRVSSAFVHISRWVIDPGVSPALETTLERLLLTHFIREPDPVVQATATDSLELLLSYWMSRDSSERCYRNLIKLDSSVSAVAATLPWKREAFDSLLDRLTAADRIAPLIAQLFSGDADAVAARTYPLLTFLGERAAEALLDALATEEDRTHRAKIVRALKAIGKPAFPPLRRALESPTWYLVRNALTVLGDLTAYEMVEEIGQTLRHDDGRVRRAAARALSRIGGTRAEELLRDALLQNDSETQGEILHALGTLRATCAIPAIAELVRGTRAGDERLRERAADVLGQIGSPEAIGTLAELLRRRGLLSGAESLDVRITAARALVAIGTEEARLVVKKTVDAEPRGASREMLEKTLEGRA